MGESINFSTSFKSVWGSTMLITGCCIGAGMIGLPVKTVLAGLVSSTVAMVLCYLFTTITGLLILEAILWFDEEVNFPTLIESTLGKKSKLITVFLYLALFYSLFVAYLDGSGIIFADLFSSIVGHTVPKSMGIIFCTALVAAITYAGTHTANRFNQFLLLGLIVTYFLIIITGLRQASMPRISPVNVMSVFNVIPILLISFGYQNLVPSITYYLNKNVNRVRLAIIIGNFIPLLIYILWNYVILGILPANITSVNNAETVTQLLGNTISVISIVLLIKLFSLCALLTSFIPNSISLLDFVKDGTKNYLNKIVNNDRLYLGVVFIPSFVFTMTYPNVFLNALVFAGGFIDVLLFGILPAMVVLTGRKAIVAPSYQVYGNQITPILILIFSFIVLILKVRGLYVSFI